MPDAVARLWVPSPLGPMVRMPGPDIAIPVGRGGPPPYVTIAMQVLNPKWLFTAAECELPDPAAAGAVSAQFKLHLPDWIVEPRYARWFDYWLALPPDGYRWLVHADGTTVAERIVTHAGADGGAT